MTRNERNEQIDWLQEQLNELAVLVADTMFDTTLPVDERQAMIESYQTQIDRLTWDLEQRKKTR